jgi:hypothetical protein
MSAVRISTDRDKFPISVAIRSLLIAKASLSVSSEDKSAIGYLALVCSETHSRCIPVQSKDGAKGRRT